MIYAKGPRFIKLDKFMVFKLRYNTLTYKCAVTHTSINVGATSRLNEIMVDMRS